MLPSLHQSLLLSVQVVLGFLCSWKFYLTTTPFSKNYTWLNYIWRIVFTLLLCNYLIWGRTLVSILLSHPLPNSHIILNTYLVVVLMDMNTGSTSSTWENIASEGQRKIWRYTILFVSITLIINTILSLYINNEYVNGESKSSVRKLN